MLKKLLQNKKRIFFIGLALLGLILVRSFEGELFYDPQNKLLPHLNCYLLFGNLLLRYGINTFFSLIIIRLLFDERKLMVFSGYLFLVLFVILVIVFFGLIYFSKEPDYLILFYIRRFLIQPLFLVLFIPAFYYQQISR